MLDRVRAVDGVDLAVGSITDEAKMIDADGNVIGGGPYFGGGLDSQTPGASDFTPFKVTEGEFADGPREVVIDAATAEKQDLGIGDRIEIQGRGPAEKFAITGIATFGDVDSIGTATFAVFDLDEAQRLFDKAGAYDEILVGGDGVPPAELRARIADQVDGVTVQSAEEQDRFTLDGLKQGIGFVRYLLLAFGVIAVFVGAFTIFNTLSITIAQRSREFALSPRARSDPAPGSALGRPRGARPGDDRLASSAWSPASGSAKGLSSVMASAGVDLPQAATVFAPRTVIVALTVGIVGHRARRARPGAARHPRRPR